ncbi:MAG: ABC-F family ATP-binding cassette domain-containing protein, partial [Bacteroidales bacterium]|nr:ABC-F family ATP-binding cassette domain-containing protein [Bacteroidales bacterium]
MISLNNLTLSFGGFTLLDNISLHITDSDRIGLVGKNGAGKTTLLRLIVGEQSPTEGTVSKPTGIKIGYLPQQMEHHKGRSVLEETLTVFDSYFKMQRRLDLITEELS